MAVISPASLIAVADTIEISDAHRQVALYKWAEVETDSGFERAWTDVTFAPRRPMVLTGLAIYAVLDLAQRGGLQVVGWKEGERVW